MPTGCFINTTLLPRTCLLVYIYTFLSYLARYFTNISKKLNFIYVLVALNWYDNYYMVKSTEISIDPQATLRKINIGLSVFLLLLGLYIMLWPLLPAINWWLKHDAPIISSPVSISVSVGDLNIPTENTLVLPALDLQEKILEGESVATVNRGIWRRPSSSTPDKASNTVLVGHRFTYSGHAVFYNLDKVKRDDPIIVYWSGKPYYYKVFSVSVVPPETVSVEAPTDQSVLTLYTCAPLWSAKDRLVIQASLEESL